MLAMIDGGSLTLAPLTEADAPRIRALMSKYRNRPMDLADATLLRVAERDGIWTFLPNAFLNRYAALRSRGQILVSAAELQQVLRETQGQLAAIRVKRTMGDSSEQPLRIRTLRRDLARIHTVIRERELKGHG